MPNIDELIKTVASLSSTPNKIFVPQVGHRMVTKTSEGRILDSGGNDFTSSLSSPSVEIEKEPHEDGQRQDMGELASNGAANSIRSANLGLFRAMNTVKSFQELKRTLLEDINTDPETIQNLENIEQYLNQIQENYLTKKESLRNQF